ncbi:MAG: flagellar basal body rod C-terminal domain-containing protein [Actinomycetota bacterium]
MSGPFAAMHNGASGVSVSQRWIDTLSHNIANLNTYTSTDEEPFRARFVVFQENGGGTDPRGVQLRSIVRAEGEAPVVFDPEHPLADEDGIVQGPLVDLSGQMTDLIIASRHFQANTRVITAAREAYESALSIGRR